MRGNFFLLSLLSLIFFYNIKCFKLPMSSNFIKINDNIDNNNSNNLRNLLQNKLETYDNIYHVLKTEICIGIPKQCFKVAYDTGMTYLILSLYNLNTKTKFTKTFNQTYSQTFKSTKNNLIALPYRYGVLQTREVEDFISLENFNKPKFLYSFLLSFNSSEEYEFDGILGLGNNYPELDEDNSFDERFSLVHNLYRNNIIKKKIFGHEYKNRTHGNIYFGEIPNSMGSDFFKCNVSPFIPYMNKWHCESRCIAFSKGENFTYFKSPYSFDTGYVDLKGPYYEGDTILGELKQLSNEKCDFDIVEIDSDKKYVRLVCDDDIDVNKFPDLIFYLKGFELRLKNIDMFRLVKINGKTKLMSKIVGDSRYNYWNLGEPILKNYNMVFNYEDNTVGFVINENLLEGDWTLVIILGVLFVIVVMAACYLISNRKKFFAQLRDRDIENFKKGEGFKSGAEMGELLES